MRIVSVLFLILFIISSSFGLTLDSPEIKTALEKAGDNSAELLKVVEHYQSQNDSLKTEAALFLIANMDEHCYVTYRLFDTAGFDVNLDVLSYPNYDSLVQDVQNIEKERGELDYEKVDRIDDLNAITSDFLIKQIDYAFRAWREKPWAKNFDFQQFCRYILPYRGSNEPLEEWRKFFFDQFTGIEDKMKDPNDPIEAAAIINEDVKKSFGFDPRYYFHPTDQGLSEMVASKLGRCEDMTNYTIYAMRANGLAVTSDYTPYWANSGNNHAWNSIVTADGEVIPFMGAEANPREYKLSGKAAKVYRKTYDIQPGNLVFLPNQQEEIPRWLKGKNFIDVTPSYTEVANVTINFDSIIPDSIDFAYIGVFNSGHWKPIHYGKIENSSATFTDMGLDIAYIVGFYENKEFKPVTDPFILDENGMTIFYHADTEKPFNTNLVSTTRRKLVVSTDGVEQTYFDDGGNYELSYWDNGWQSLGKIQFDGKPLKFENVPSNGLYWLTKDDSDREERIFIIKDNQQIFW